MPTIDICQRQLPKPAALGSILDMGIPDSKIYKALFDLSQSIAGHTDLETLCNSLAGSLRHVVSFDFLALVLHDPVHDQLRLHAISTSRPYKNHREIVLPADGDHFGALVWRDQKPLVLSPLYKETQYRDVVDEALQAGIQAIILVPLSNGDRRLGSCFEGLGQRRARL
ncbi:GAF domain-containing protein, partial [Nitrospirales bacterium NOB]|nr:GAF domain-containing protein [Nitrospirales bacterium NOB]